MAVLVDTSVLLRLRDRASEREPARSNLAALRAWQPFTLAVERVGEPIEPRKG